MSSFLSFAKFKLSPTSNNALIALDHIDEVIKTIRESYDDADKRLMERFGLSEIQAAAILAMQLRRLQGLERDKIEEELKQLCLR